MEGKLNLLVYLFIVVSLLPSCSRKLRIEKKLAGSWNITSLSEDGRESLYDMTLQVISFGSYSKEGFVPDWLDHRRKSENPNTKLENYKVIINDQGFQVFLSTKSEFFGDTFFIEKITDSELILSNKNKRVVAFR
jgi:hypothetical protein